MTINQSIVSSNIRGLQSRTHGRGRLLAQAEAFRSKLKAAVKALRDLGDHDVAMRYVPALQDINEQIREGARSQTLDRQLLKQQYVLQGLSRPPKLPKLPRPIRDPRLTAPLSTLPSEPYYPEHFRV